VSAANCISVLGEEKAGMEILPQLKRINVKSEKGFTGILH
jgi:hypothetical protein